LPIRRSDRANAAFPLQITGARPTDITSVVLHDLPEQAWLSKGRRQDEHTWVLRPTDLGSLRLSMGEGTPDAFDLTIEVAAAGGNPAGLSVARVRLLDAPAQVHAGDHDRRGAQRREPHPDPLDGVGAASSYPETARRVARAGWWRRRPGRSGWLEYSLAGGRGLEGMSSSA
jgi:hypothetical protein